MRRPTKTTDQDAEKPGNPEPRRRNKTMDQHTTKQALALVGQDKIDEWADGDPHGLVIRIHKTHATWALRGRLGPKQSIWTIGDVLPAGNPKAISLTDARKWAREAKGMLSNGTDLSAWLREKATGGKVEKYFDQKLDGLTWVDGRDLFLKFIADNNPPDTLRDYSTTLMSKNVKDFGPWENGKLLKHISENDVKVVRQKIIDRGAMEQSQHTMRVLSSCLGYLTGYPDSGITENVVANLDPVRVSKAKKVADRPSELSRYRFDSTKVRHSSSARCASRSRPNPASRSATTVNTAVTAPPICSCSSTRTNPGVT